MPNEAISAPSIGLKRIALIVTLAVSLLCVIFYASEGQGGPLHAFQSSIRSIFNATDSAGALVGSSLDDASDAMSDSSSDELTLSELRDRVDEMTALTARTEEYRLEAQRLQELLSLKDTYGIEGVACRVIGKSTDAWNRTITLDAGTDDGVDLGQTVVGSSGVIGQVSSVTSGSCVVRLLEDPKSGVAAMVQSTRADGIVRGSLSGLLHLENMPENAEVSVGDVIITSGLGGSFIKGLLIGMVVKVDGNTSDGTRSIVVAPTQDVAVLEEVIVVFSASESAGSGQAINLNDYGTERRGSQSYSDAEDADEEGEL